jgi:enoyl-[acyl-carrier-protein] reductase (NADH)
MKTLAGSAIGGARATFRHTEENAPLRANATLEAIGGHGGLAVLRLWRLHDGRDHPCRRTSSSH